MRDKKTFIITLFIIISMILAVLTVMAAAEAKNRISARSAALYLPDEGIFLYEKSSDIKLPMASTTKIMTALVVVENADLADEVTVSRESVGIEGSSLYLEEGDKVSVEDLLYSLMLRSANDAASALAIHVAKDVESFSHLMNAKAESLGLSDTSFANPHGLDSEEHYTTAHDLAIITAEAMKNPTLRKITSTYKHSFSVSGSERTVVNHNKLLREYEGATGVKTGFTKKSGRCLVSSAERDGIFLIAVTLDAPDDWRDHKYLLDYGFSEVECHKLSEFTEVHLSIPVIGGESDRVQISAEDIDIISLKDDIIETKYDIPRYIGAGLEKGSCVGKIIIYKNKAKYKEIDLTLDNSVKKIGRGGLFSKTT